MSLIEPGATLGVLGGGQLGRMFVQAAQTLGYAVAVLDPDPASPAGSIAQHHLRASYDDADALDRMADLCAAVTTEFENVPAAALAALAARRVVAPHAGAVLVCQDRSAEKAHFVRCGVACAPHATIASEAAAGRIEESLLPGILKTMRLGYDGKGQVRVATRAEAIEAWQRLGRGPCLLEALLPLRDELSVIVARDAAGRCVHFPVQHNVHRDGILAVTRVPSGLPDALRQQAIDASYRIAEALGYIGVLCVEFFVVDDGSADGALYANEMAPRPHNSGHYTIDACDVSQFELQVRTLAGLPLATPRLHSSAVMLNLLGDLWFASGSQTPRAPRFADVLALAGAHLHLYGKAQARRGRKMGHLTLTARVPAQALETARAAAAMLGLPAP